MGTGSSGSQGSSSGANPEYSGTQPPITPQPGPHDRLPYADNVNTGNPTIDYWATGPVSLWNTIAFIVNGFNNALGMVRDQADSLSREVLGMGLDEAEFVLAMALVGMPADAQAFESGINYLSGNIRNSISAALNARRAATRVATPYGDAVQALSKEALAARTQVEGGSTLYRIGTTGRSAAGEAQFWSLESPLSPGYASRYGVPAENIANANFIETATLRPGTAFITRPAPGIGTNIGGGIEVVVPTGGVDVQTFLTIP